MKGTHAKFGREKIKGSHYYWGGMAVRHHGSVTMHGSFNRCSGFADLLMSSHSTTHFGGQMHVTSQNFPPVPPTQPVPQAEVVSNCSRTPSTFPSKILLPSYSQNCKSPNSYVKPPVPVIFLTALCSQLKPLVVQGKRSLK